MVHAVLIGIPNLSVFCECLEMVFLGASGLGGGLAHILSGASIYVVLLLVKSVCVNGTAQVPFATYVLHTYALVQHSLLHGEDASLFCSCLAHSCS